MVVYISTKFHETILGSIKVIEQTRFSSEKFQKGHNSVKMYMELEFLFFAHRLMMVYICTKFHENILNSIRVMERTDGGHDIIRPVFDGRIRMKLDLSYLYALY